MKNKFFVFLSFTLFSNFYCSAKSQNECLNFISIAPVEIQYTILNELDLNQMLLLLESGLLDKEVITSADIWKNCELYGNIDIRRIISLEKTIKSVYKDLNLDFDLSQIKIFYVFHDEFRDECLKGLFLENREIKHLSRFRNVEISGCNSISVSLVKILSGYTVLDSIKLIYCRFDEDDFRELSRFYNIRSIFIKIQYDTFQVGYFNQFLNSLVNLKDLTFDCSYENSEIYRIILNKCHLNKLDMNCKAHNHFDVNDRISFPERLEELRYSFHNASTLFIFLELVKRNRLKKLSFTILCDISKEQLLSIIKNCYYLESLEMIECDAVIDKDIIEGISELQYLKKLKIVDRRGISIKSMELIANLLKINWELEEFEINDCIVNTEILRNIFLHRNLKSLIITGAKMDECSTKELYSNFSRKLEQLDVSNCSSSVIREIQPYISSIKSLKITIDDENRDILTEIMRANLSHLETLEIMSNIPLEHVKLIAQMRNLKALNVRKSYGYDDELSRSISHLKNLKKLHCSLVIDECILKLVEKLPNLKEYYLPFSSQTDPALFTHLQNRSIILR